MRRKMNKGISMVEILISIAIFALLMIPIVQGIVSSVKNTTNAKTLQYRNEFAENMMEYVKQDSLVDIMNGDYFSSVGSYTSSGAGMDTKATFYTEIAGKYDESLGKLATAIETTTGSKPNLEVTALSRTDDGTGDEIKYPYESYRISGKVNLGTEHDTYSYVMEISNKYYAEKRMNSLDTYVDPNHLELGVVEDIDHTKVALINGTIANYDQTVTDAFSTKKIELLKSVDPDWYEIYTEQSGDVLLFTDDEGARLITVTVSGSEDKGYKVECSLKYRDDFSRLSVYSDSDVQDAIDNYSIEYKPFVFVYDVDPTTGKATLPNIYLMYNTCIYNKRFVKHDYIAIDTSGVKDDTKVNCFVVETAETYSKNLTAANKDLGERDADGNLTSTPTLYNTNALSGVKHRRDVKIHMAATSGSKLENLSVYHNFDLSTNTDVNLKNTHVLYSDDTFDIDLGDLEIFNKTDYIPLVTYNADGSVNISNSVANFDGLNGAKQESRGLYEIKIWVQQGDSVDTTKNPTMTGTKGGNES